MAGKGAKRREFEKRRRFCGVWKILGGPAGCLARILRIQDSHRVHRGHRDFNPRMARIFTERNLDRIYMMNKTGS